MLDELVNKIVWGSSRDVLIRMPIFSVDCTVTSPPYKNSDGYDTLTMYTVFEELLRVHKPGTYMFMNFGHLVNYKSRPFELVDMCERIGWKLHDTIIWRKKQYSPQTSSFHLNNLFEYIFMFRKGPQKPLDRLSIGVPYKDKANIRRYGSGADLHCGGNVWDIGYDTIQNRRGKLHDHRFPDELPMRCMKLVSRTIPRNGLVFDPFGGSFTTMRVANELGYRAISCDISLFHCLSTSYKFNLPMGRVEEVYCYA